MHHMHGDPVPAQFAAVLLTLLIGVAGLTVPVHATGTAPNVETRGVLAPNSSPESGLAAATVSCLGDSITHGYPYGLNDPLQAVEKTYPSILQSRLDNRIGVGRYVVANHGINGLKAEELRANLQTQGWLDENPAAVLIMIGGNDLSAATSVAEFMGLAQETVQEVQDVVNIIKAHVNPDGGQPAIIVSAFPPNRLGVLANQGIIYYNGLLKSQLTGVDLFFSDNFDDLYDSASGQAKPGLMYDTVHPNDIGYTLIAENWDAAFVQVMGDILARTHGLGLLREDIPADARVTPIYAAALPTHFDWRQKDGYNWMTSVKNQASCGSCVAFAAVGATEGQLRIQANNPGWNVDLSEQHLFSCGGGLCWWGWYISSALSRLRDYGTPDEACSPYQSGDGNDRSCPTTCNDGSSWQSRAYKISSYSWIGNTPSAIQAALMDGPLVAAFDVYTDFFYWGGTNPSWTEGVYRHTWGDLEGGHAIVIVGYDSNQQYWIVKNSWGNWGESGYFKIAFGQAYIEQDVASLSVSTVTATRTVVLTQTSTSYASGTTTSTSTRYTATRTTTSTVPTVTTVVLVPVTVTSTVQNTQYQTSTLTTTVTSHTATQISTSTIPTVTTIALVPLVMTSMVQSIQYLTSILTTTVTSYTGTETSTSTVVVPTTVTIGPSTSTVQTTQVLTSTGTTTVTGYTTTTVTSYTGTETSTSTSVVHTTVTILAGAVASSPLTYLGFLSLFAVTVRHRATVGKGRRIPRSRSAEPPQASS